MTDTAIPATPALRVLGIDPGLSDVGYGIIEWDRRAGRAQCLRYGVVRTSPALPLVERLLQIHRELSQLVAETDPTVVVVEELFFAANVRTAMVVAHGRAACILAVGPGRLLVEYTPLQIKKALTGHGRAGKLQVQWMVRALLGLKEVPHPDHAADALGAALCYVQSIALDAKVEAATRRIANPAGVDANPLKAVLKQARGSRRRRRRS